MVARVLSEQLQIWRLVLSHMSRHAMGWMRAGLVGRILPGTPLPDRLVIAPQDIRTADPIIAEDIYAGRFAFVGQLVEVGGQSPFEIRPPSAEWSRALHEFGWLRHLRVSDRALSQSNARALIEDWIRLTPRKHPIAWAPEVVARRVQSWLSQSPLFLEGCNRTFYRRFMRSLHKQIVYLRNIINEAPEGMARMRVAIALAAASASASGSSRFVRQAAKRLDYELEHQILPDGGHISRSPGAIIEILADLLPVRQAFNARGIAPSQAMMNAIDRMMPMLRFFWHGDGSFALFNGMSTTPTDLVATILAYDDARGAPPNNASHSGYQRIASGRTVVILDAGPPPPAAVSHRAHAGCLSFEMSSGRNIIVVNCGAPTRDREALWQVVRATAAHSTAVLNDTSSCRFLRAAWLRRWIGTPILSGPKKIDVDRREDDGVISVTASHDGYARRFNVIHERGLLMTADGGRIIGVDRFRTVGKGPRRDADQYAIRFHLHPTVKASRLRSGDAILIVCPDGEAWEFTAHSSEPGDPDAEQLDAMLEESIYLSDTHGHRRTEQIVVYGRIRHAPTVTWSLTRQAAATATRGRTYGEPELPL
ncbi:putative heparinase superfamily protein [Rhodobium orientis]|nr:heparinase II/III family protein [Rhodobium orientis]MBB4304270.1 putative heparinase superfamily protein [Rhodobium orientis]